MTRVLHVQKVSGISGSEAHLLSLLPLLRERGWDARMVVLHEGEPGAREFIERMTRAGVPVELAHAPRSRPGGAGSRLLARAAATILHTHLVHGDVLGLPAGALARVPVRVSTKHGFNEFRERAVRSRRQTGRRRASRTRRSPSRAGSPATSRRRRASTWTTFTVVHYGIAAGPEPPPPPASSRGSSPSAG